MSIKHALFIHIPKCAGSSVQEICRANNIVIDSLNQTWNDVDANDPRYMEYYKFAFVRNPWDRMVSCWAMFSTWRKARWLPQFTFREFLTLAFDTDVIEQISTKRLWTINPTSERERAFLIEEYLRSIRNHSCPYTHPFCKIYNNTSKHLMVDYVGRFERLQKDFDRACDIIGLPKTTLPTKNKSQHRPYFEYYTDETIEIVANKYQTDVALFNYEFGK